MHATDVVLARTVDERTILGEGTKAFQTKRRQAVKHSLIATQFGLVATQRVSPEGIEISCHEYLRPPGEYRRQVGYRAMR